jgi:hypothetical protein
MMAKTNLKSDGTGDWAKKRLSLPEGFMAFSVRQPSVGRVERRRVVTDSARVFTRGTIEDRMDSENAGIVFLD